MKNRSATGRFLWSCSLVLLAGAGLGGCSPHSSSAVEPVSRPYDWWQARHLAINERVRGGGADLLFIGDSITHGWEGAGRAVWDRFYAGRNAANLGIGGDCTQHVLWRLDNGNLDGIAPKAAVVLIGTNNWSENTAKEIAAGVRAVVEKLRDRLPETRILLLALFPRGDLPEKEQLRLREASRRYSRLAADPMVTFLDIGGVFLDKDGRLPRSVMPDLLHLSETGYELWAGAMEPVLHGLLQEKLRPEGAGQGVPPASPALHILRLLLP